MNVSERARRNRLWTSKPVQTAHCASLTSSKSRVLRLVMSITELSNRSNEDVLSSLKTLIADGNRIVAKVIAYLAEVEDRRLYLELACASMFQFCTTKLAMSEGEAFRRLT